MCFDDSLCDRETEPDSTVIVVARLPEIVEQMLDVGGCDSGSRVGDVNRDVIAVRDRAHRHVPMLRRELEGVAHDVSDDLRDTEGIGANGDPIVWRNGSKHIPRFSAIGRNVSSA